VAARPLCPVVLSMLAASPRRLQDVARALERTGIDPGAGARTTLARLLEARLIRAEGAPPAGPRFRITPRGRRELHLQVHLHNLIRRPKAG
jgi:DNA-binding PadR family transcriptional regulator